MAAIGSLFEQMTLLITRGEPRAGGLPLPQHALVVPLRHPTGSDTRRKLSVMVHLAHYMRVIAWAARRSDVVHVPLPGDIPFLGMCVAMALRKRLIARYGGSWVATSQTTFMNRITRSFMRMFAGGRNVMLVSGAGDTPPAPKMNWIFVTALSSAEVAGICPDLGRNLANPPEIVYAGRLSPEKGVKFLIKAISLLKQEGCSQLPVVTLIGDGPERRSLAATVEHLGCRDIVSFTGQLDRSGLSEHMSRADICVQPSLTEGFSKAWLDAMSHGLPVVATEVGAAAAVVGRNGERGWLVPPGDARALAGLLRRILTEPVDWPSLRRRCRSHVEQSTLEVWAREIGGICESQWNASLLQGKLHP